MYAPTIVQVNGGGNHPAGLLPAIQPAREVARPTSAPSALGGQHCLVFYLGGLPSGD